MFFTEKEIDKMFTEAGIAVVDEKCENKDNHISPKVLEYLENKWGKREEYEKENARLKKIGEELLKEIDE
jgi:hypothetical protein